MLVVKIYDEFNFRRYGNPWIAQVNNNCTLDFTTKVGGYTGGYNKGEAGQLYITNSIEGKVYAFGQKDYRGKNGGYQFIKIINGEPVEIEKAKLIEAVNS